MSVQAMTWAIECKCPTSSAKLVLLCLANYASKAGEAHPGQKSLAEDSGLSVRSVVTALKALEDAEIITRSRRVRGDGSRTSDQYILQLSNMQNLHKDHESNMQNMSGQHAKSAGQYKPNGLSEPVREPSDAREGAQRTDIQTAFDKYNEMAQRTDLPIAQVITPKRSAAIKARLKEGGGLDGWNHALSVVEANPFFTGDNDRGWKADLDFICTQSKFTRIMEGSYAKARPSNGRCAGDDLKRKLAEQHQRMFPGSPQVSEPADS